MKKLFVCVFLLAALFGGVQAHAQSADGVLAFDYALTPQAAENTTVTSAWIPATPWGENLFLLTVGTTTATAQTSLQVLSASTIAGANSTVVSTATMAANTEVIALKVTLASVLNTEKIIINGLTFTAHTNTTTYASRQFKIDGNDAADAVAFAACVNHPEYGIPGVVATVSNNIVTIRSLRKSITVTAGYATKFTVATLAQQMYLKVLGEDLTATHGFLACKVYAKANTTIGVTLLKRGGYYSVYPQMVAYP